MTGFITLLSLCIMIFYNPVTGVDFRISKQRVLLGSTGTLEMQCDINEQDVKVVYNIQIRKIKSTTLPGTDAEHWDTLASMAIESSGTPTLGENVVETSKDYVAGGSWNTETPGNSYLTVSMNMEKLTCDDARYYSCKLTYKKTSSDTLQSDMNATFSAYVKPKVTSLNVRKNGFIVQGLSPTDTAAVNVGDELELTCSADIGSLPGTIIRWHRTSETATNNEFIGYQPPQGTFDEGTATSDNQCGYTREAKITYNATAADANRDNQLAFECFVTVSGDPYGNSYTSENNPKFYADVTDPDGATAKDSTGTAGGSDTAAIVGGIVGGLVLIVLIVLLVYFLWYRRRNSGEDYATKEEYGTENPNIAPPVDMYATVDKTKKNKKPENGNGVDEPLKPKPKPRGGQQELHYAELDLTKNPPVAPRKKRQEPVEYAEVEFHSQTTI